MQSEDRKIRVLDLCTGSGAIALAVALKSGAEVSASDVSEGAMQVARANALNADADIKFIKSDMWTDIADEFDVIVSNPPYIPTGDIKTLDGRVKGFEPLLALDGGDDGLRFYREIALGLDGHLAKDGALLLEFGINQADAVAGIFADYDTRIIKDMAGIERIAIVKRKI